MQQIVIIKTGSTLPTLLKRIGDFEDWIISGMGGERTEYAIVDACRGAANPDYAQVAGIVITGSHAMLTDHLEWRERIAAWLPGAVARNIPILGICYGHQLLAYALGGEVGNLPDEWEYGTTDIHLEASASNDPILKDLPNPARLQVCHAQTVLRLPAKARRLASSELENHQAFIVGKWAWGVQFHPEFDAEVTKAYIEEEKDTLIAQGKDPAKLSAACHDTPWGNNILQHFYQVCQEARHEQGG